MDSAYHAMDESLVSRKTYKYDLMRGAFRGVLATGASTFSLFIAIRYFHAGDGTKSLIAAAPFIGMFLSLVLVHYVSNSGLKKSVCGAVPALIAGLCLLCSAWAGRLEHFVLFVVLAYVFLNAMVPFLTSIYTDNYPASRRGAFYSKPLLLTVALSALFSFGASRALDMDIGYYPLVFAFLGVCGLGKAFAVYSMPSKTIEKGSFNNNNPFSNLKYAAQDRVFGYVLFTWFIMGFANLWTQPLRVDYVTSKAYGIEGSAFFVAMITAVIPDSMRLLFIPFWARLFDRMNFIALRMILNVIFGMGIGLYFLTREPAVIALGSALIGIGFAGGSIAWGLWVTKYAPPGKAAAYMSVHVSLTGVRGALGPMIGFWAVNQIGPVNMGLLSCGMMVLATAMLIPEIGLGKRQTSP
ncbi:MAG: MFS transporter [Nitrospinae bacterium]|nr:MFS transporter [Nitrospinota bacterium]